MQWGRGDWWSAKAYTTWKLQVGNILAHVMSHLPRATSYCYQPSILLLQIGRELSELLDFVWMVTCDMWQGLYMVENLKGM